MNEALFPPEFIEGAFRMGFRAAADRRAPFAGVRRSAHPGESLDFHGHDEYRPGDDIRRMDWNVFRRCKKLAVRRFRDFPRGCCRIVLDTSRSIHCEEARVVSAFRAAAALGCAILANAEALELAFPGTGCAHWYRNGKADVPRFLADLALRREAPFSHAMEYSGGGLCWVVSDFLEADLITLERKLERAGAFSVVRIFSASEEYPDFSRETRLVDCEYGYSVNIAPDRSIAERYRVARMRFHGILDAHALRSGMRHYALPAESGASDILNRLFPEGLV